MYGTTNYRSTGLTQVFTGLVGSLVVGSFLLTILAGPAHLTPAAPVPAARVIA